ncbi:hypothetical protein G9F71_008390 [Clostridium sp. FP2]|uniref:hypothetical protein n=1 Tax=Clostridium sp. FP2 TaxID=2724481 RepID=UPI0013E94C13|nr:hypothetical protein [Clostridium sp. FP2]MBZ9622870.1 hypothetical protein [Clostridium sp. FP2]
MKSFDELVKKGFKNGFLTSKEVSEIDFNNDKNVNDYFEALDELINKGIQINFSNGEIMR